MQETEKPCYRDLTVANIRYHEGADFVEILFLESARFFQLPKKAAAYAAMLGKLERALASGKRVRVGVASIESGVIEEVE